MTGLEHLRELLDAHGDWLPLDEAAIAIAVDEDPMCRPDDVLGDLDTLAAATQLAPGAAPGRVLGRINELLFNRMGFTGDTQDMHHPDNSCIHRVLGRQRGMPITLCVVYAEIARRIGVTLDGVGFPAHFLLRPRHADNPVFIDAFHGGRLLDEDQVWGFFLTLFPGAKITEAAWKRVIAPISNRAIAARIVRNLMIGHVDRADTRGVLRATERLLVLDPTPEVYRDHGAVLSELGKIDAARDALATYLALAPNAEDAAAIALRIASLGR